MRINLIACTNKTNSIGDKGKLLYRFKKDLQYFKKITMGSCVIMGAKTFIEIGQPLPGRFNIVIAENRQSGQTVLSEAHLIMPSLGSALEYINNRNLSSRKVFVIGGASLYNDALEKYRYLIERVYLNTVVDDKIGDVKIDTLQLQYIKETFIMEGHTTWFDTNNIDGKTYCISVNVYNNPFKISTVDL